MKKIISVISAVLFAFSLIAGAYADIAPGKMNCMMSACCPVMKECTKKCGDDSDCLTNCSLAREKCIKSGCKWTDDDMMEVFRGADDPCD